MKIFRDLLHKPDLVLTHSTTDRQASQSPVIVFHNKAGKLQVVVESVFGVFSNLLTVFSKFSVGLTQLCSHVRKSH